MLAVILLKLPTILILLWVFRHPEGPSRPGRRYRWVLAITVVHVLLALLSLTGEKSSLSELFVAYPLSWSVLFRNRLRDRLSVPAQDWLMGVVTCLLLWFEETWVVLDYRSPPLRHYVHYFGFYVGLTASVAGLYRRYRYPVRQRFVVGGLWGTLVEQQCAGPKLRLSGNIVGALGFALYIFPVYGLYLAESVSSSSRSSTAPGA